MTQAICPECDAIVNFDDTPLVGEVIECAECGVELEVMSMHPLTVDLAPEVEEDWGE